MEGPIYPTTMPFRPIPVYGQVASAAAAKLPPPPGTAGIPPPPGTAGMPPLPLKTADDRLTLHLGMVSQMNQLRAFGEYHLEQLRSLRDGGYGQLYEGLNKFHRAAPVVAPAPYSPREPQTSAVSDKLAIDFSHPKPREDSSPKERPTANDRATAVAAAAAAADRVTVPVIVSCANPFASQYGYGRKVFPCPQCRYTTDRRNNLKRHMLTMHQTCTKVLECCGILFATKASLREHAMIFHYHGYTCFYCGRRFCRKALLKRHLSVHNGQKDFVCSVCDYATSHKSNLERHRKVHCRPDDGSMEDSGPELSPSSETWRSHNQQLSPSSDTWRCDNVGHDEHVLMTSDSDDENEEINVDSD